MPFEPTVGLGGAVHPDMKILYHHRTASRDGQAVHIDELIDAFRRLGHEVIVVSPSLSAGQEFGKESGTVAALKRHLPRAAFELLEIAYSLVAYRRLVQAYREHRPDVLYERFNLFLLAGVWLRRSRHIPFLLEVNAPLYDERRNFGGLALKPLAHWFQRTIWRGADKVLPVTDALAEYVRRDGVTSERIEVIQNGINPKNFLRKIDFEAAKARFGLQGRLVLGFAGFVRDWHGLDSVIELLAETDPSLGLSFLIIGDSPGCRQLARQAEQLGVADRLVLAGLVERDSIPEAVSAFDIALQPAVTVYASPLKLFEYMALARAIVAPRQSNIEETLTDGENALLFEPNDRAGFRACVERLCRDAALRLKLGTAARQTIIDRDFTWDANARRIEALFKQALERQDR